MRNPYLDDDLKTKIVKAKISKEVRESKPRHKDFFQAHLNDDVYIKRVIAKKGGVGGIKLG